MTIGWRFDNTYFKLSKAFKEDIKPIPVKKPELVLFNKELAENLNLDFSNLDKQNLSELFSGNSLPEGSNSLAQAYAGHQFGHFTMLGDGRAVLIGEHLSKDNKKLVRVHHDDDPGTFKGDFKKYLQDEQIKDTNTGG